MDSTWDVNVAHVRWEQEECLFGSTTTKWMNVTTYCVRVHVYVNHIDNISKIYGITQKKTSC